MIDWFKLSLDLKNNYQVIDSIKCFGLCLIELCEASEMKIDSKFKCNIMNMLVLFYCELEFMEDNNTASLAKKWIKNILLDSRNPDSEKPSSSQIFSYIRILELTWQKFDRALFSFPGQKIALRNFESEILDVLNIKY